MTEVAPSIVIAIDGPSASGKSTVARIVAQELGAVYVDSGSLYRGMTWQCVRRGVDVEHAEAVVRCLEESKWDFFVEEGSMRFFIDGDAPGEAIRGADVTEKVSLVAALPEVRAFVLERLRSLRELGSLSIEGRDIGSAVFPDTPYKFYIDCDPAERARRRSKDHAALGEAQEEQEVLASLQRRDEMDSTRKASPLQVALGAQVLDSTHLSAEQVAAEVLLVVRGA